MTTKHVHVLDGCTPVPLAHYLKGLGILRLVGEQADASARAAWTGGRMSLSTVLDKDALLQFFLNDYAPTPMVTPWNGGSGFNPKDNREAFDVIRASDAERFSGYRRAIDDASAIKASLGIEGKVDGADKERLIEACRAGLDDDALAWLDAAVALTTDGPGFPPLLGTGGNDGRLEFSKNHMEQLLSLFSQEGEPRPFAAPHLEVALFGVGMPGLPSKPVGQFLPAQSGGANGAEGFSGRQVINPWDFVLMMEGAMLFASGIARRLEAETDGGLSYPFAVRPVAAGYASAAPGDESDTRAEMWLPQWESFADLSEVQSLLAEGRGRIGGRTARDGVDFARAVTSLGVDRGISRFQRYSFQVRNGLSYFATPMQELDARPRARLACLSDVDGWLAHFRGKAKSGPASLQRALRHLESRIFAATEDDSANRMLELFLALGDCERALATSHRWALKSFARPVPLLSRRWEEAMAQAADLELRLALAAASINVPSTTAEVETHGHRRNLRSYLAPVVVNEKYKRVAFAAHAGRDIAPQTNVVRCMLHVVRRHLIAKQRRRGAPASLDDISDFIEGRCDDERLLRLIWSCSLLEPERPRYAAKPDPQVHPPALYSVIKLALDGTLKRREEALADDKSLDVDPSVFTLASRGFGGRAVEAAARRLRGWGRVPVVSRFHQRGPSVQRAAAAVLFCLSQGDQRLLEKRALRTQPESASNAEEIS